MILETIAAVNTAVNNFVWGIPAMVCIIGVGLLLERAHALFADTQSFHMPSKRQSGVCSGKKMPPTVR